MLVRNTSMSIYPNNCYTYLIGWSHLNIWYYGRRTARNCRPEELWVKYFTSSKYVEEFRKIHGEPNLINVGIDRMPNALTSS